MIKKVVLYIAIFSCLFVLTYYFKIQYSYADFKGYADGLLNASSMIFTLMGIWIAFLYPNALSRLTNPSKIATVDFSEALQETRRLEAIVLSVLKSGSVVVGILAGALIKLFFNNTNFVIENINLFKAISISLISTLSYLQAEAIFGVIFANIMFLQDLHGKREDREIDEDI